MDHLQTAGLWILGGIAALAMVMHPHAAAGAGIGVCFFLASPRSSTVGQRWWLGLFSLGIGYSAGVYWYPDGPPWSPQAMLPSVAVSAFAAVIATALTHVINNSSDLPRWLKTVLDYVPFLNRGAKGSDDGA